MLLLAVLGLASASGLEAAGSCSGLGEEPCISKQPKCQYCGSGGTHMPQSWAPCLTNSSSGIGPCTFPTVSATASYNGTILAKSSGVRVVENGFYFPRADIEMSLFSVHANKTYQCTWKGECQYYHLDGMLKDAMWSYETEGVGKCVQGWCPSGYTCKDIINFGEFDASRVTIVLN